VTSLFTSILYSLSQRIDAELLFLSSIPIVATLCNGCMVFCISDVVRVSEMSVVISCSACRQFFSANACVYPSFSKSRVPCFLNVSRRNFSAVKSDLLLHFEKHALLTLVLGLFDECNVLDQHQSSHVIYRPSAVV